MADLYSAASADNYRMTKSKQLIALASGVYNIIRIPKMAFVTNVWAFITTPYIGGTPTVIVGYIGDASTAVADGFMTNDIFDPKVAGLKRAQHVSLETFEGKYFSAGSGSITVTISTGSATTLGRFNIFASYSVIY